MQRPEENQDDGERADDHPDGVAARVAGLGVADTCRRVPVAPWAMPLTVPSMASTSTIFQRTFSESQTSGRTMAAA